MGLFAPFGMVDSRWALTLRAPIPGPASYRRGGPLTVTDCNVLLGKLSPDHFPYVFGPDGNEPLDVVATQQGFASLADEINAATGQSLSPEDVAEGFLKIAVDNMANAIKKISVERGHDLSDYTLQCFGGAGGQHACLVADALGMTRVLIHPFAGVLSAYGMGLADIRALREVQADCPLTDLAPAEALATRLMGEARTEVAAQGLANIRILTRAYLRYTGSHQTLDVPFGAAPDMAQAFEEAHKVRFGFAPPGRDLILDMLAVEAIGDTGEAPAAHPMPKGSATLNDRLFVRASGWGDVPLYERPALGHDACIIGPAIISEPTGTNIVEPGWSARVDAFANLILTRDTPVSRPSAAGTVADPILLEVMSNLFMSVADQMGATLANTSWSVNIKERFDFSCAIFDAAGHLVANAPHVPVHLGSMSDSIQTVMRLNPDAAEGDAFVLNSPYRGGTHLPDITVVTPRFS